MSTIYPVRGIWRVHPGALPSRSDSHGREQARVLGQWGRLSNSYTTRRLNSPGVERHSISKGQRFFCHTRGAGLTRRRSVGAASRAQVGGKKWQIVSRQQYLSWPPAGDDLCDGDSGVPRPALAGSAGVVHVDGGDFVEAGGAVDDERRDHHGADSGRGVRPRYPADYPADSPPGKTLTPPLPESLHDDPRRPSSTAASSSQIPPSTCTNHRTSAQIRRVGGFPSPRSSPACGHESLVQRTISPIFFLPAPLLPAKPRQLPPPRSPPPRCDNKTLPLECMAGSTPWRFNLRVG